MKMIPISCSMVHMPSTFRFVLILLAVIFAKVVRVHGEIRCYCNLPVCVSTGYMCKSAHNACFTEHFAFSSDLTQSRHGCLELLHGHKKFICRQLTGNVKPNSVEHTGEKTSPTKDVQSEIPLIGTNFPTVFCCQEDMCNYISAMDIHVHVQAKTNHSHNGVGYNDDKMYPYRGQSDVGIFANQDLWFKAAVIAVPIAGSFILILLILLAAHMLKQDSRRQRHLSDLRRQRQFKARLLLGEAYGEKPTSYHHYHHVDNCGRYSSVSYARECDILGTDIDMSRHNFVYERPVSVSLCGSLLPLTKWDNSKSPAFV